MTRHGSGEHIVPTPEYIAAFVHASGLSLRQTIHDTSTYWGPVEWSEYHNKIRAKLAATPGDAELISLCHGIQKLWDDARQAGMMKDRFGG